MCFIYSKKNNNFKKYLIYTLKFLKIHNAKVSLNAPYYVTYEPPVEEKKTHNKKT